MAKEEVTENYESGAWVTTFRAAVLAALEFWNEELDAEGRQTRIEALYERDGADVIAEKAAVVITAMGVPVQTVNPAEAELLRKSADLTENEGIGNYL